MSEQEDRQKEDRIDIEEIYKPEPFDHKKYKNFYQLSSGIFMTLVVLCIGGFIYSKPEAGYWVNIYATLVGTILTIAVLDRRAEQRTLRERKEDLILQMGSPNNGFAVEAVRLLARQGWLSDGSLKNANLLFADLHDADLKMANLLNANLRRTNLNNASLDNANLQNVNLSGSNLQNASLRNTILIHASLSSANSQDALFAFSNLKNAQMQNVNLQGANLAWANLQEADLLGANFQGAVMEEANLQGARLSFSKFSSETRLPDGSFWTSDRDMREFTNPNHPKFWRSKSDTRAAFHN